MLNKVSLIGNLGRDPEVRTTQSGLSVATLSVATNEKTKKDGNWVDHTEWHRVVVFGKTAENVQRFCRKGKSLYIEGKLRTKKWTDKDNVDRWTTEILADSVTFLGGGGGGRDDEPEPHEDAGHSDKPDDDIPF